MSAICRFIRFVRRLLGLCPHDYFEPIYHSWRCVACGKVWHD